LTWPDIDFLLYLSSTFNLFFILKLKCKVNISIEKIINEIKLKLNDFNSKIELIINKQNDQLLSIEYEVHQILGNLATYLMLTNDCKNDKNLYFIPKNLDEQINDITEQ
jgi:hypothetical protein